MGTSKVTPPAGLHPDSLPPDYDGWDKEPTVPDHPLGSIRAIDYDTGLPIVKRKAEQSGISNAQGTGNDTSGNNAQASGVLGKGVSEAKPAATPEAGKPTQPKAEEKPGKTQELTKGSPVTLPDGTKGKVMHMVQNMGTVRVRTDDGRNLTVRQSALKVAPHVMVVAHARKLPER
ncbi:MAG TPA: hypothetical protein VMQ60_03200 [Acidobacteriaceae bacterium]|jgi:preprotein translocase subunit YajC|nr:hypothetical protein [Acidobacteriaceae bacterium]